MSPPLSLEVAGVFSTGIMKRCRSAIGDQLIWDPAGFDGTVSLLTFSLLPDICQMLLEEPVSLDLLREFS